MSSDLNLDGKKFSKAICFVGGDLHYGVSMITILHRHQVPIIAIYGETAEIIWARLSEEIKKDSIKVMPIKRPWEDEEFNQLCRGSKDILGVNCGFTYIIPKALLDTVPVINIHSAALPFNKGCHHSFWGIIEKTAFGATLHWMAEGLDAGPIIAQKTFGDDGVMTAQMIQERSDAMCLELCNEYILNIFNGKSRSTPQEAGAGSYHSKKEIIKASTLIAGETIKVENLFDLCRATCNKNNGFIIHKNKRNFLIRIAGIEEIKENKS